ncbi:SUMO-activating enzyme subunit 1A-like [Asparagus officinalis]|uniref:SUMO-activating enzyme subunit 1A-like n=1 Tax=Asparagus officinalis TaxID=4686 RepID=UPI00098E4551|nr:SUMO-activating enzyme subunit 1A-like [Asparagus officinalis]
MDGEELSAQETALYDRQIRVWGVDDQKRLSKTHVLANGLNGTAEFCKNIILAGVGSLTIMDDHIVTEDALSANFLIPPASVKDEGSSLAELCCDSLKEFNPMFVFQLKEITRGSEVTKQKGKRNLGNCNILYLETLICFWAVTLEGSKPTQQKKNLVR